MRFDKEIIRENLISNVFAIKDSLQPGTKIYAVVKANAYGHGLNNVVRILDDFPDVNFVVSNVDEAKAVRKISWMKDILIIGGFEKENLADIKSGDFSVGISSYEEAKIINDYLKKLDNIMNLPKVRVHIAVNTMMNRFGFNVKDKDKYRKEISKILKLDFIEVSGIYSHLSKAEMDVIKECEILFDDAIEILFEEMCRLKMDISKVTRHLLNSAGTSIKCTKEYDAIRIGLLLYGYYPNETFRKLWESNYKPVKPCLNVKSKISFIRKVKKNEAIGYNSSFVTNRDMTIGIVSSGYDDGFKRSFGNKLEVMIGDKKTKVIGDVCMNQFIVDLTGILANVGDNVYVLCEGIDGNKLAEIDNTIVYEILCNFK